MKLRLIASLAAMFTVSTGVHASLTGSTFGIAGSKVVACESAKTAAQVQIITHRAIETRGRRNYKIKEDIKGCECDLQAAHKKLGLDTWECSANWSITIDADDGK